MNFLKTEEASAVKDAPPINHSGGSALCHLLLRINLHTHASFNANAFSRDGYAFLGWSTDQNATTETYTDEQSVSNLTDEDGGTVKLYAVWTIDTGSEGENSENRSVEISGTNNSSGDPELEA